MGSMMSGMKNTMEENRMKSQEFMLETQRKQMERQIQMQLMMREKMMATGLARARDLAYWYSGFYGTTTFFMIAGFMKTKNPITLVILIPLSFIMGYQLDNVYGNKMERIAAEADYILENEQHILRLPGAPINFDTIEAARNKSAKS